VALLAGLIGERSDSGAPQLAVAVGVVAAVLDGADGWFARRTGMASAFGARFDMETDALLIMALAALAWQFGKAGPWVLLSGLLRYLFVASGRIVTSLRQPLPASNRRKCIAVAQLVALLVTVAPFVPVTWSAPVAAAGLCALVASFAVDVAWLLQTAARSRVMTSPR
jgi:phosphatidylglycerophosphate synthase